MQGLVNADYRYVIIFDCLIEDFLEDLSFGLIINVEDGINSDVHILILLDGDFGDVKSEIVLDRKSQDVILELLIAKLLALDDLIKDRAYLIIDLV